MSETVLHIELKPSGNGYAELRYYFANPNQFQPRQLQLSAIDDLITKAETDYYTTRPDLTATGKSLFNWLDSADRFLSTAIQDAEGNRLLVLAISTAGKLAHLPWETLHDGTVFLVESICPPIVPVRWKQKKAALRETSNRALQVLFMAASPHDSEPQLDFEAEEKLILDATSKQPIALMSEESGNLRELGTIIAGYPENQLDILHLTGHATHTPDGPRFLTETDIGTSEPSSGADLAQAFERKPKLVFLSGCRTGQAMRAGDVPSLAETLLDHGYGCVLGWGRPVLDGDASLAAATLYRELALGKTPAEALAKTYQTLLREKARDWHLLRLYVMSQAAMPPALVKPSKTPGWKPAPPPSIAKEFLDPQGKIKVPTRENFVGRRRAMQHCLRVLRYETEKLGVVLHGMGGLGKSSLAARLCDRLPDFGRVFWFGPVAEFSLVNRLVEELQAEPLRAELRDPNVELRFKLRNVFEKAEKPFLLVLDDFEQNFETDETGLKWRDGLPVLSLAAKEVLAALAFAIKKTNGQHRVIVTSRYEFETAEADVFHFEPLDGFRGSDLQKKIRRIASKKLLQDTPAEVLERITIVADGNPRLLEWLFNLLTQPSLDLTTIFDRMTATETKFRESILAQELLNQQESDLRRMLARALVYELPVPVAAVEAVCPNISNLNRHLERATVLGLIEVTALPEAEPHYRVPRILAPLLESEQPANLEVHARLAAETLYRMWMIEKEVANEIAWFEIHRLAMIGRAIQTALEVANVLSFFLDYTSRFRECVVICEQTLLLKSNDYRLLNSLATAERMLGKIELAKFHYQMALQECPSSDLKGRGSIQQNIIDLFEREGRFEDSLIEYQALLELFEKANYEYGQANSLLAIGRLLVHQGKIEEAKQNFDKSLRLWEKIGFTQGEASALHELAKLSADQGFFKEAEAGFQTSLRLKKSIPDVQGEASTLLELGALYTEQGQYDKALAYLDEALMLFKHIGGTSNEASAIYHKGNLFAQQGQHKKAIAFYWESYFLREKMGDDHGRAELLLWIAHVLAEDSDFIPAISYSEQAWAILLQLKSNYTKVAERVMTQVYMMAIEAKYGKAGVEEMLMANKSNDTEKMRSVMMSVSEPPSE